VHPSKKRVLIFGDSNSSIPDSNKCWPSILSIASNGRIHVITDSVPGRTTGFDKNDLNACYCIERTLYSCGVLDAVLIMLGTNDVKRCYGPPSANDIAHNFTKIFRMISEYQQNLTTAFLLPPPIDRGLTGDFEGAEKRIQAVCAVIRNVAAVGKIPVVDTHSNLEVGKHLDTDGVHLNKKGRHAVAETVNLFLFSSLFAKES